MATDTFDIIPLQQLVTLLSSLDSNLENGKLPNDYWLGDLLAGSQTHIPPNHKLEEIFKASKLLKNLHCVLNSLTVRIEQNQERLLHSALHHGIRSLPDDILVYIVDILSVDSDETLGREKTNVLIRQLSSVSRAFRAAVVGTVSLWTKIDNEYCLGPGFETRIRRTKSAPLTLEIEYTDWYRMQKILSMTLPFKERWQHLSVGLKGNVRTLVSSFSGVNFSRLESLYVNLEDASSDESDAFFAAWAFPKLRSLKIDNALPLPGVFPELTSFKFYCSNRYEKIGNDFDESYGKLVNLLMSAPRLQNVSIDVSRFHDSSREDLPIVAFSNVHAFSMSNYAAARDYRGGRVSADTMGRLVRSFRLPKRCELCLGLFFSHSDDLHRWISSFSASMELLESVSSLSIAITFHPEDKALANFFTHFPNVENLEVDVLGFGELIEQDDFEVNLGRLRSIALPDTIDSRVYWNWRDHLHRLTSHPEAVLLTLIEGEHDPFYSAVGYAATDTPY